MNIKVRFADMLTVGVGGYGLTKKESSDETTHS